MKALLRASQHRVFAMVLGVGFAATFTACGQQAKAPIVKSAPPLESVAAATPVAQPASGEQPGFVSVAPPEAAAAATPPAAPAPAPAPALLSAEQLDQLVAPVALYPDPLLAQLLPAATYPLEVVQAARWAQDNKALKGEALEKAIVARDWAPSVKALCAFPDVLSYMDENLDWTSQLGDAVLGQEQDVLDAIQRMRAKAQAAGTLKSNDKQTVEVETAGDRTVVVIEPAEPEVIYVPRYDPEIVYYPQSYAYVEDYWAPSYIGFGFGFSLGAFSWWWNDCDWYGRRIVSYRDYDDWWDHGYRWRRHCRIDWDDYDWDRVDWRHCDRLRYRDRDIDIRHFNIDNIDINRCDWRRTDFRKFDWNRVDWRRVNLDRVDLRHDDWRKVDWGRAGISDPSLVERLRNLSPQDREWMRGRFEQARGNQKYKDLVAKAQLERGSRGPTGGHGDLGSGIDRWKHDPTHRRGVAYRGPASDFPNLLGRDHSGDRSRDGAGSGRLLGSENRGHGSSDRGGEGRSGGVLGALRDRFTGGKTGDAGGRLDHDGDRGRGGLFSREGGDKGQEAPKADLVKRAHEGTSPGISGQGRGRDGDASSRILEGLRGRGGDGDRGQGGDRGLGGLFSREGGDKGQEAPKADLVKRAHEGTSPGIGGQGRGRDGDASSRILEGLRGRGGDGDRGQSGDRGLGGLFSREGGDKGQDIPRATRVPEAPKTHSFSQSGRSGSSSSDFSRMLESFRQRGSEDRSRDNSSFSSRDRGDDNKSRAPSRSFDFSKKPEPFKESRAPSRQLFGGSDNKGRDFSEMFKRGDSGNRSGGSDKSSRSRSFGGSDNKSRDFGEMFKRGDSGSRSGGSDRSSFSRSSGGSEKRSFDRKSSGGGFKSESRKSSGGDKNRGGDRGGDRGKRDKDD